MRAAPGIRFSTRIRETVSWKLVVSCVILAVFVVMAVFASMLAPFDPEAQQILQRKVPPIWHQWLFGSEKATWTHPLGTDALGRDYASRLMHGARVPLLIGIFALTVSGLIGVTLGVIAGYFRGWIDTLISTVIAARLGLPIMIVSLTAVALYGASLVTISLVLGLLLWDRFAVAVRAATIQLREMEYVDAARAAGASDTNILLNEILPNLAPVVAVIAALEVGQAILLESVLSFLGLGVQPPDFSWGLMIAEAKVDIFFDPWLAALPGTCLFIIVLGTNLLSEWLEIYSMKLGSK